jgi:hypothetical protein
MKRNTRGADEEVYNLQMQQGVELKVTLAHSGSDATWDFPLERSLN